jgi:hypothetical protein
MTDKITRKIALTRALRNVSKVLRDLDDITQDVDNVRHSIEQGFAAQAVVSAATSMEAALEILSELYEKDYP